jgi:hypothetical protein
MKAVKMWTVLVFAAAVAAITATRLVTNQTSAPRTPQTTPKAADPSRAAASVTSAPAVPEQTESGRRLSPSRIPPSHAILERGPAAPETAVPAAPKAGKEPLQDPVARVALSFVGADPEAEAYWCEAINDPGLSGHERSDLIEDLNEDGLSDPKRPTLDDLPVILNRLRLIQELAPNAMDQVNLDAFAEAYKDLLNLADVALGGGQPVR